ncbi:hypothetical protein [Clostridioides sp. ZZV15-6598]|nr:hypothetical protein [Clostridioides sp. ZZV15-6598]
MQMSMGDKFSERFLYVVLLSMVMLNSEKFTSLLDSSFTINKESKKEGKG